MSFFSAFKKQKPSNAFSFDNGMIRFVSLERSESGIQVVAYGSESLGTSASSDGRVVDDAQFVKTIRTIATNHKLLESNVVIPDHEALCFHTHVSKEPEREMNEVIIDHIKAYCVAHDLLVFAEYICEYDIILITEFGYDIHVTLVPKAYVTHLSRLFKQAGIMLHHIETAHHAVSRACLRIPNGVGYVAVSFGKEKTSVSLVHGEHLVSHEIVPIGVESIYQTIEKTLGVGRVEAERIMHRHGLLKTHPDNGLLGELYLALAPIYRSVDRQLIELGQIPYKQYGQRFQVNDLLVYGEGVLIKGLTAYLGERTNLRAQNLDVWAGHREDRASILNMPAAEAFTYAEALSLGLLYLGR